MAHHFESRLAHPHHHTPCQVCGKTSRHQNHRLEGEPRFEIWWVGSEYRVATFDTQAQVNAYLAKQTLPQAQFTVVESW